MGRGHPYSPEQREAIVEEVEWFISCRASMAQLCRALSMRPVSLARLLDRWGRGDLARVVDAEAHCEERYAS